METLPALLQRSRQAQGLSKRGAAQRVGCSDMTYRMWEKGSWEPGLDNLDRLVAFTGQTKVVILGAMGHLTSEQVKAAEAVSATIGETLGR